MSNWIKVCTEGEVGLEEIREFQWNGKNYIICRSNDGEYYGLDGLCTHEKVKLCEGMIFEDELECPKHFGTFDIKTGEALSAPVYRDLKSYPIKIEDGNIFLGL